MLSLQGTMFILLAAGFVLQRAGLMGDAVRKGCTDFLIDLFLPCSILVSFNIELTGDVLRTCAAVLGFYVLMNALFWVVGKVLWRKAGDRESVLRNGTLCSNASFMGLPFCEGMFGVQGMLFGSVALIPVYVLMFSVGLAMFTPIKGREAVKKVLTHPCVIAVALGFVLMAAPFELPAFAMSAVERLSACTTPVSMLVIGAMLASSRKVNLRDGVLWGYCALRLLGLPLLVLGCALALGLPAVETGVCVLLAAMPMASTSALLAEKYGGNAQFASHAVFVSTLLAMASLPLVSVVLDAVL